MKQRISIVISALIVLLVLVAAVEESVQIDLTAISQIKTEGLNRSQVMSIAENMTDINGPRLTNSPGYFEAAEWAKNKMIEWGFENVALEPWGEFGAGWSLEYMNVYMSSPDFLQLIAHPQAWTGGTDGMVSGTPVHINIQTEKDMEQYKGKLAGKIVMNGGIVSLQNVERADFRRHDHDSLESIKSMAPRQRGRFNIAQWRARRQLREKIGAFLKEEGVAVVIRASERDKHTVRNSSGGSREVGAEPAIPQLVLSVEQYNRIIRLLKAEKPVTLNVEIKTKFHTDQTLGMNIVGEIPGSDPELKDQVVIIGGHFDSWHPGTGATDNASGCAVAMEAARLIKSVGLKPRRTIRVALWGGEEQGLLGSRGYVRKHYANPDTMETLSDYDKFQAYFNMDNGTGGFRGIYLQGNEAARAYFESWLKPFHDMGAATVTFRNTSGTDHLAFDAVGLPGFQFIQEPAAYMTRTHHTNVDVFDQLVPADMIKNSIIMAAFAYNAAMMDEQFPRKAKPKPGSGMRRF